jgi:hypothetical protein
MGGSSGGGPQTAVGRPASTGLVVCARTRRATRRICRGECAERGAGVSIVAPDALVRLSKLHKVQVRPAQPGATRKRTEPRRNVGP